MKVFELNYLRFNQIFFFFLFLFFSMHLLMRKYFHRNEKGKNEEEQLTNELCLYLSLMNINEFNLIFNTFIQRVASFNRNEC